MKRRTFLTAMAGGMMLGSQKLAAQSRPRRKGGLKKLVVLFQRGGNDGLNTMFPVDSTEYSLYQNLRPTLGVPLANGLAIPGNSFFALHPALSPLQPVMNAGKIAFVHAVGYPNPDRSHFESQAFFETGVPGNGLLDGWLNRYLSHTSGSGLIRGITVGSNIQQSVTGAIPVPVSENFGEISVAADGLLSAANQTAYADKLRDIYELTATSGNDSLYQTGSKIYQMVDSFSNRNLDDYVPENGASYPNTGLGYRVRHAAQMLKDELSFLGVEVVTIEQGGYDTHSTQANATNPLATTEGHPQLLNELASCMQAFYTDMGSRMNDVLFLVVTEFGRRAYENESFGTDHGTGGVAMLMGAGVTGGAYNGSGRWPGLGNLFENDDLDWVTDYRDLYWEVLSRHMGVDNGTLANILPGHSYSAQNIIV